jgi:transposase
MTQLALSTREFAQLLTPAAGNDKKLTTWIDSVRRAQLPYLHAFANGLELDRAAVNAGLTLVPCRVPRRAMAGTMPRARTWSR